MSDWQVGDLALCIDAGPVKDVCGDGGVETNPEYVANLIQGRIYEVTHIAECKCGGGHVGIGNRPQRAGGWSDRFRKVRPDEHEACEPEFVTLIKRAKRPVSA